MPVDAVKVTDPVTGATYLRPRLMKKPEQPDNFPQGTPKPATCRTQYCKKAGLCHDKCECPESFGPYYTYPAFHMPPVYAYPYIAPNQRYPFDPYYARSAQHVAPRRASRQPTPFIPPRPPPSLDDSSDDESDSGPFIPARPAPRDPHPVVPPPARPAPQNPHPVIPPRAQPPPERGTDRLAEENAFQRWIQSFPHWGIPREMPPDWNYQTRPPGRYTPYRAGNDLPPQAPVVAAPNGIPAGIPAATPWSNATELPNRVPNRVEWDNVAGGRLQWTPHPWVAHPIPHPNVPANAFWSNPGAMYPWRGPDGWSPYYGIDRERMHMLTGGHPLPGMDPFWTATRWNPPRHPPQHGVYLSPWLSANPRNPYVPHVLWDAAVEPPYSIRRLTSRGNVVDFATTDFFKQSATFPPVTTVQVNLPSMRSSWGPVTINKDSPISVGDVFNAVWEYLHKPVTSDDWTALRSTYGEDRAKSIAYSFSRRCWTAGGLREYIRSQGVKRVDFLEGKTVYWGTYLTYNVDWTWSLTMAFLPRVQPANS